MERKTSPRKAKAKARKEEFRSRLDSIPAEQYEIAAQYGEILDYLDPWFSERITKIPVEAMTMSIDEIKQKIVISETIQTLRDAFWLEFWKAKVEDRKIAISNIIDGICTKNQATTIMKHPLSMAYILKPVMRYEAKLNSLLSEYGTKVIREILDQPCVKMDGGFDTNLANLKLRAIKQLEDRLQGTPIQRTETKELKVSIGGEMSIEEINRRLQELDKQIPAITADFKEIK
jgi:hypothetical protein